MNLAKFKQDLRTWRELWVICLSLARVLPFGQFARVFCGATTVTHWCFCSYQIEILLLQSTQRHLDNRSSRESLAARPLQSIFDLQIWSLSYCQDLHSQGTLPLNNQYKTTPMDHMSLLGEYTLHNIDSGDMYKGVPMLWVYFRLCPLSDFLTNPKSAILIAPFLTRRLAGLMSLWTYPQQQSILQPLRTSLNTDASQASVSLP